jgi:hypothetical protein
MGAAYFCGARIPQCLIIIEAESRDRNLDRVT